MGDLIAWLKDRWWLAGAVPLILSTLWWVIAGGAAPLAQSISAASTQGVAEAIRDLPLTTTRVEEIAATELVILEQLADIADDLVAIKSNDIAVVDWAEGRTLELNDGLVCHLNETCTVWLRGRRTPQGADCRFIDAGIYVVVPGSEEGRPVRRAPGWEPANLQLVYKSFPIDFVVPADLAPGRWHFVSIAVYADCPFSREGEVVERPSVRVPVMIVDPGDPPAGANR